MEKINIYEKINNQIISKLEAGKIPWRKTWKQEMPKNYVSKKFYHGINFILLSCSDFASNYFLTFLQCKELKGSIKAGEKALPIVFYKLLDLAKLDKNGELENKSFPYLQYSNVFNLQQTSLYIEKEISLDNHFLEADEIIKNVKNLVLKNNFSRCFFDVKNNYISTPTVSDFDSPADYYSTIFHELIHWTGHPSRLNRFSLEYQNKQDYSFEELVAEIGSAYLCNISGITNQEIFTNQSGYIQGWLKELNNDNKLIFKAAAHAQKAVDYITQGE